MPDALDDLTDAMTDATDMLLGRNDSNPLGGGSANTAVGMGALQAGSPGSSNTALGRSALAANTASSNTAVGASASATFCSSSRWRHSLAGRWTPSR